MCWACLQENHLNLPQSRESLAAFQTVSTSKALLAKLEYPEANWANTVPGDRGPVIVTYSFLENYELPPVSGGTFRADSYFSFSQTQRANFRKALDEFTRVTGLIFVEKSGGSMIEVHGADGSNWAGWANYPNSSGWTTDGSTLVIDEDGQLDVGTYGFTTALHEIGHAVGLKHPFEGQFRLSKSLDSSINTVMSYTVDNTPTVLARLDVAAVQTLYGKAINTSGWSLKMTNSGLVVHTSGRDDVISGAGGISNKIYGLGGDDTLYGRESDDSLIGGDGRDLLFGMKGDDRLYGGSGADTLYGDTNVYDSSGGRNVFYGGSGADSILGSYDTSRMAGGSGNDTLISRGMNDSVLGDAGDDVLVAKQGNARFYGGDGADKIKGALDASGGFLPSSDALDDRLYGGAGYDTLIGRLGEDMIFTGAGGGVAYGGDGDDRLWGGASGRSRLLGGAGNDLIYGGLATAGADGGSGDDTLWGGDSTARAGQGARLFGGSDDDLLRGLGRSDQLFGGYGNDTLLGVSGNHLDGGSDQDVLIFDADMAGQATISGFAPGYDSIIIQNLSDDADLFEVVLTGQSDGVMARITPREGDAQITLFLRGVDLVHVTADMFTAQSGEWLG